MISTDFSVLTLNIHKGFSTGQRRFTLENIRNCLRDSKASVVFLQEVVGEHRQLARKVPGWPQGNQLEFLADSVWSHHAYGKNAIYQHGHHGNAILSEVPFKSWHNLDVSLLNFSQRGILHGVTANDIHLLCIHFGLFESERRSQARKLVDYINKTIPANAPLILAGDFNDWRKSIHNLLVRELHLQDAHQNLNQRVARTFPSFRPILPMDRIYLRGFQVRTCEIMCNTEWRRISDHCALLAGLSLRY
ncbi:MAG: endonuclease/exonuclease/phosphatase family protein [Pseudomonadales bacterium]|nr:endonuclease/exonuclease/phosphatase family protein [Pseudomonadales bacterium]MCP5345424.1 endonuclease/exonuclease/phosphatase family protein [Pseudomonadales bacterium]